MSTSGTPLARDQLILDLRDRGWSQREIGRHPSVGLSQPAVKYILDAAAGKPRQRDRTKENRNPNGNITKKNTICIGCGKLCWGNSRTTPKAGHLCMDCRRKQNLVHCDYCGREYQRRHRNDQPGRLNYCSTQCKDADRQRAAREQYETPELVCEWCGDGFCPKDRNRAARFCSRDCYNKQMRAASSG